MNLFKYLKKLVTGARFELTTLRMPPRHSVKTAKYLFQEHTYKQPVLYYDDQHQMENYSAVEKGHKERD